MPDLLDRIRVELRERLETSRAAAQEYERLERALAALGGEPAGQPQPVASSGAVAKRRGRPRRSRNGSAVVTRQKNREALIAAVRAQAGITREQVREVTGLSGASVAQGLRRLVDSGVITKTERTDGTGPTYDITTRSDATTQASAASSEPTTAVDANGQAPVSVDETTSSGDGTEPETSTNTETQTTPAADATQAGDGAPPDAAAPRARASTSARRPSRRGTTKKPARRGKATTSKTSSAKAESPSKAADKKARPRRARKTQSTSAAKRETSAADGAARASQQSKPDAE